MIDIGARKHNYTILRKLREYGDLPEDIVKLLEDFDEVIVRDIDNVPAIAIGIDEYVISLGISLPREKIRDMVPKIVEVFWKIVRADTDLDVLRNVIELYNILEEVAGKKKNNINVELDINRGGIGSPYINILLAVY